MEILAELVELVERQEPLMVVKKEVGSNFIGVNFEVECYDGWTNYLLWEKQVKGVLRSTGRPMGLDDTGEEYDVDEEISEKRRRQEQVIAMNVMMLYLKPYTIKNLDIYE